MPLQMVIVVSFIVTSYAGHSAIVSRISYDRTPEKIATGMDQFRCKGKFDSADILKDIGYTDGDLSKGVTCRKADFRGDGSMAYWVYKCDPRSLCQSKVLFMKDGRVNKSIKLNILDLPDVYYKDQPQGEISQLLKKYHCPIPNADALVEIGDGDGRENHVHQFNSKTESFEKIGGCTTIEID